MYVESVPNRSSPPAVLLRESYREHGKVKKRTLANLSKWPAHLVEGLRVLLKGGFAVASFHDAFDIVRSQPHGHVAALRAFARKIGLDHLLGRRSRMRDLALALILSRLLSPASKLATARGLHPDTLRDSLADVLELDSVDENDLYAAMDWLRERQDAIEQRLATQHLAECPLPATPERPGSSSSGRSTRRCRWARRVAKSATDRTVRSTLAIAAAWLARGLWRSLDREGRHELAVDDAIIS